MNALPWAVAAWLLGVGLYGIVTSRHFVHLIGCLSVVQASTYVLLLAAGFRWHAIAPIFTHLPRGPLPWIHSCRPWCSRMWWSAPQSRRCCLPWRCSCTRSAAHLTRMHCVH